MGFEGKVWSTIVQVALFSYLDSSHHLLHGAHLQIEGARVYGTGVKLTPLRGDVGPVLKKQKRYKQLSIVMMILVHLEERSDRLRGGVDIRVQVSVSVRPGDERQVADGDSITIVIQTRPEKYVR